MAKHSQASIAYESIRTSILSGNLFQGQPISEMEMAEKLNMSRTPVREALSRLRSDGLLEYIAHKGVVVRQFSRQEIEMAYVYAQAVEGMLAGVVAENAANLDFTEAESCLARMQEALNNNDSTAWANADNEFHDTLRKLCGNSFLVKAVVDVYGQINYTRMLITRVALDKATSTKDHGMLLEYMKMGDVKSARESMEAHLCRIRNEVMRILYNT